MYLFHTLLGTFNASTMVTFFQYLPLGLTGKYGELNNSLAFEPYLPSSHRTLGPPGHPSPPFLHQTIGALNAVLNALKDVAIDSFYQRASGKPWVSVRFYPPLSFFPQVR
jgi:hypothetical protein